MSNKQENDTTNDLVKFFMSKGNTIDEIIQWMDLEIIKLKNEMDNECIDTPNKN